EIPNVEHFRQHVLELPADAWLPLYGAARGELPLTDVRSALTLPPSTKSVAWLQGEIDVSAAGDLEVAVTCSTRADWWLDAEPFEAKPKLAVSVSAGRHKVTLRIELPADLPPA